jgi:hypothetical protein
MIGYAVNVRLGAFAYNAVSHLRRALPNLCCRCALEFQSLQSGGRLELGK